ncbi:MAG TPA: hypothetical protein VF526_11910 [Solirubrobacteraceae bacterium]
MIAGLLDVLVQTGELPAAQALLDSADLRAWGTFNRLFAYLIDDEVLDRNPMKAVPKSKLASTAPRAIRHENVAETILAAAATPGPSAKRSKRSPERDVAMVALYCVTGIRLAAAIAAP